MALIRPSKSEKAARNEYVRMRAYLKTAFGYTLEQFEDLKWDAEFLIDMWNNGDGIK